MCSISNKSCITPSATAVTVPSPLNAELSLYRTAYCDTSQTWKKMIPVYYLAAYFFHKRGKLPTTSPTVTGPRRRHGYCGDMSSCCQAKLDAHNHFIVSVH